MRIEMSPLIDCIFQLLIFFMLSSTFLNPTVRLELPRASAAASAESQHTTVTITTDGDVYVNAERVTLDYLPQRLRQAISSAAEKTVTIRGDKNMKFDYFMRALDAAKQSGAEHVDIAHEPAE
jgi:biopolymer transport protein ExbD